MAEHTGEPHIEVDDLVVHYGDVMAIKGVRCVPRSLTRAVKLVDIKV
jgi:hypothetical protein